jgi:hypothetical protein
MGGFSGVVIREPLLEIGGHADIALLLCSYALDEVDVKQDGPPSLKLRRAILLRFQRLANPAKLV